VPCFDKVFLAQHKIKEQHAYVHSKPTQTRFAKQKVGSAEMPCLQELRIVSASRMPAVDSSRLGGPLDVASPPHSKKTATK